MAVPHPSHRNLPLVGTADMGTFDTCSYKCGQDCWHEAPNRSDNETFGAVVARVALTRRSLFRGGLAAAIVLGSSGALNATEEPLAAPPRPDAALRGGNLGFRPIAPTTEDDVVVPDGYDYSLLARWGDPITSEGRRWDINRQTAARQRQQFGYNCDYVAYFPLGDAGSERGLLWVNHEYTDPVLMFPGYVKGSPTREQVDIELAAHGGSVMEIARRPDAPHRRSGRFRLQRDSRYNRRITAETPILLTGPAAGHPRLQTNGDPSGRVVLGMLNNCAGGMTPWGTVLSGEENFNQYFLVRPDVELDEVTTTLNKRYGVENVITDRGWEQHHPRFDTAAEPNEPARFGWVVEIDPFDPDFTPRKRTALGRMKHEGAETSITADGRVAVYMGDDERFEYIYKFVTDGTFQQGERRANLQLLDSGTLYVARFDSDPGETGDGYFRGEWIPLVHGKGPLTEVNGFGSQADISINTRAAADAVAATKMDRPEDVERNPHTGGVYAILTNNTRRTEANAVNPRTDNKFGHVIEMLETGGDAGARSFEWTLFLVAGNPSDPSTHFAGFDRNQVSPISCPDNVAFDNQGNVWIATDGQPGTIFKNDGFFAIPSEGEERGHVQQFLSVPRGAEACGPMFTPDNQTLFCAVQHPGEGGTLENPLSQWPDYDDNPPRPSVVSIYKTSPGRRRVGT